MVPSWEKATQSIDAPQWALVFSVTHLMSVAIILRTREKKRCLGCRRAFGSMEIWDHSTARLQVPKGADMQQPTACRKDECGMWLRSSSRTKSHMPLREAAQLGVSGLGSQVVVKRTWVEMVEAAASSPGMCCSCCCVESHVKSSQSLQGRRDTSHACFENFRWGTVPGGPLWMENCLQNPSMNGL